MNRSIEEMVRAQLDLVPESVRAAYVFGSVARGEDSAGSDVDVALLLANDPRPDLASQHGDLASALERRLARRVDLVILNTAPVDLIHRVLRDGVLVLDRDPAARVRFEVRARNDYFDLLPFLRRYRRLPERAA
jgi:predicted nucleotidyltransferase